MPPFKHIPLLCHATFFLSYFLHFNTHLLFLTFECVGMDCELLNRAREYRLKLLRRDSECDLLEAAGRKGPIDDLSSVEKMAHQYLQRNGQDDDSGDDEDDVIVDDYSVRIYALAHYGAISSSL
jgi:hypothetical protein